MSETAPLFSVVTVCKNCKDKLISTASSVHQQTFRDFEYIVKDGASTDGTLEACIEIEATKIISGADNGIFNAMNIALNHCSGKYVSFLNAGDTFCDDNVLSVIADDLSTKGDIDFLFGNVVDHSSRRKYVVYPDHPSRFFLYANGICHQVWFVKRSLYLRLGKFDETKPIGGDYLFLLKSLVKEKVPFRHVNCFIANYEGSGVSSNKRLMKESEKERQKVREDLFCYIECILYDSLIKVKGLIKKTVYDTFLFRAYRTYGLYRYKHGKYYRK